MIVCVPGWTVLRRWLGEAHQGPACVNDSPRAWLDCVGSLAGGNSSRPGDVIENASCGVQFGSLRIINIIEFHINC